MNKDYYNILNISRDADIDTIKKAYKNLAMKWHPDKNVNNKIDSTEKFKEISEAYSVLSDPNLKEKYDKYGSDYVNNSENMPNDINPFNLFNMFFNGFNNEDNNENSPIIVPYNISLKDIYTGLNTSVIFDRFNICNKCDGSGTQNGNNDLCTKCKGNGNIITQTRMGYIQMTCNSCHGGGINLKAKKCSNCIGKKYYIEQKSLNINIPPGVTDKYEIIIHNEGNVILNNKKNSSKTRSDVIFIIKEETHNIFKRGNMLDSENTSDLCIEINLSFIDSIFGFEKTIIHLDNHSFQFCLNIPSRHFDIFILKNEGLPILNENKKGDLFIIINVEHPPKFKDKLEKNLWYLLTDNKNIPSFPISNVLTLDKYKESFVKQKSHIKNNKHNKNIEVQECNPS